jgi:hypothetical protein
MDWNLINLDDETRAYMVAELDGDVSAGRVFASGRLSPQGHATYQTLLRDALASGTPESLSAALSAPGLFNPTETTTKGVVRRMASNAPALLAGGEFNRYYMRGVSARSATDGSGTVTIYRARESGWHRDESDAQIGRVLSAPELLADLRDNTQSPERVDVPDVNSGLSVRL